MLTSANPGNPALCLSLSQTSDVAPDTPTCGPFNENGIFTRPDGSTVSVRGPFNGSVNGVASFAAITYQKTIGFSNYNSFEATLRHTTKSLELMAAYTYGKSIDDSSSLSEPVYPMGAALTKAISAFDLRHNFVASYRYLLPFERLSGKQNRWVSGWSLSGITRFSTGLPVTLYNNTDSSLLGTFPNGINNNTIDTPYFTPGNLKINHNPSGNPGGFQHQPLQHSGSAWEPWAMSRAASSTAPAWRTSTWRCRRRLRCTKAKCCSSVWRHLTSSITLSSSARPPSMEISAAPVQPASVKSSTPCRRARCSWRRNSPSDHRCELEDRGTA